MKQTRQAAFHTRRDAWVDVNLSAVEHNAIEARAFVPKDTAIMAVIKGDAYGHGALMILPPLLASGISMVGVASVDEALQIRQADISEPILVLSVAPDWAMAQAISHQISLTVFTPAHCQALERVYNSTGIKANVHVKVDTGMHRIGVGWEEAADFITFCQAQPYMTVDGMFTHLAQADSAEKTQLQMDRWTSVVDALAVKPRWIHCANSSGTWHYPIQAPNNVVRLGLALMGYPSDRLPMPVTLKPVLGLKARIVHIQSVQPGEGISYNHTIVNNTGKPMRVATLPLGYADGIPRSLSNKMSVLIQGQRCPQVGIITMDQLMIDITEVKDAQIGDTVTVLGESGNESIRLNDWAALLGTIEYELMCGLRVRLPKTYVRT